MDIYTLLSVTLGVLFFLCALVLTTATTSQRAAFLRDTDTKWLAWAGALSVIAPLAYYLGGPVKKSIVDAYLLRQLHMAWQHVFIAYCLLTGLMSGGIFAWLFMRNKT